MSDASPVLSLREARDLGGVISTAFGLLRQDARGVASAILRVCAPALIGLVAGVGIAGIGLWIEAYSGSGGEVLTGIGFLIGGLSFCTLGVLLIAAANAYVVLYRTHGGPAGIDGEAVRRKGHSFFWRFAGVNLLLGFGIGLLQLVAIIPCLGFLAFLAGAAYLFTTFSVVYAAIAWEDEGVFDAFGRSRRLVEGHWWTTFGIVALSYLLYYLLLTGSALPFFALAFAFALHTGPEGLGVAQGGLLGVSGLAWLVGTVGFQIVPHLALSVHYFNLRERSEHTALAERVTQVSAKAAAQKHGAADEWEDTRSVVPRGPEKADEEKEEDGLRWKREGPADA